MMAVLKADCGFDAGRVEQVLGPSEPQYRSQSRVGFTISGSTWQRRRTATALTVITIDYVWGYLTLARIGDRFRCRYRLA